MMKIYIYTLIDPRNNSIRYIGKTERDLQKRLDGHIKDKSNNHKSNWIKSLAKHDLKPLIEEIDLVDVSEWQFWEKYWISQFKTWGFKLTNESPGGEGGKLFQREDVKKKISETLKLKNKLHKKSSSEETKRKISESLKRAYSEGRKQRKGQKQICEEKGIKYVSNLKNLSKESIKKRSITNTGKKRTDEQRKKISNSSIHKKIVYQYSLEGDFINEYTSLTDAANFIGLNISNISVAIKNNSVSGGYKWSSVKL